MLTCPTDEAGQLFQAAQWNGAISEQSFTMASAWTVVAVQLQLCSYLGKHGVGNSIIYFG